MWRYLLKTRRFHGSYEHVAENLSRCDYFSATETKSLQCGRSRPGFSAEVPAETTSEHLAGVISIIVVEMVFRFCAADRLDKYAKSRIDHMTFDHVTW